MTTAAGLVAVAVLLVCWPRGRTHYRLRDIAGRPAPTAVRFGLRPLALVGVPIVGLLAAGPAGFVAAGIVVVVAGWRHGRRRRAQDEDRRRADLIIALNLMGGELSVGAPPARACATAAADLADRDDSSGDGTTAIADGLGALAARAELGGGIAVPIALAPASDSVSAPGVGPQPWYPIASAWHKAETHGLPLAEMLGSLRADLAARQAFAARTQAGLAGPRATAAVLAGLPLLGIALGQATGANPVGVLGGGGLGGILLVVGTALAGAGVVWSERITDKAVRP